MSDCFLNVTSKTWTRDSHGLFDYESSTVKENVINTYKPTKIIRKKHEVKEKTETDILEVDDQLICNVKIKDSKNFLTKEKFVLSTNNEKNMTPTEENINELQNKIWYIIKPESHNNQVNLNQNPNIINENEGFELKLNDIMKLGRIKYVMTDLCINKKLTSIEDSNSIPVYNLILNYTNHITDPEISCKYCLSNDTTDGSDPLIKLCVCNDSMSVHYQCVKRWISVKLSQKKNTKETVSSYNIKCFNCDICKTPYPCNIFLIF